MRDFVSNIHFDSGGLDLIEENGRRINVRHGFSYYSGEDPARTPGQVPISRRRRFVILDGQPGPDQWKIAYISTDFSRGNTSEVRAAIDGIELASEEPGPVQFVVRTHVMPPGAGTVSGGGLVEEGRETILMATPSSGFRFTGWSGAEVKSVGSPQTSLVVNEDVSVTANFIRQWELTVSAGPGGRVSGAGLYDDGSAGTITATPADGFRFGRWNGDGVEDPTAATTRVTMNANRALSAHFVKVWSLTVTADEGGGASGSGIYDEGSTAAIAATAAEGYRFAGWTGDGIADAGAAETTAVIGGEATIRAHFVKVWSLTVTAGEGGEATGSGIYDEGSTAAIAATAAEGYRFAGWTGDGIADAGAAETTAVIGGEVSIRAHFVKVWSLTVTADEGGEVSGSGIYDEGSTAAIAATAAEGYRFAGWTGDGIADAGAAETTAVIGGEVSIRAHFVKVWSLTVTADEGGEVTGSGIYDDATAVIVSASVNDGYRFDGWTGEGLADPAAAATELTLTADITVIGRFIKVWSLAVSAGAGGQVEGGGKFDDGAAVPISAVASEGFRFVRWEGSEAIGAPMSARTSVTLRMDTAVTALFQADAPPGEETDADGDGLPDAWEENHRLDPGDPSDAVLDFDGDGRSNEEEFSAGTDPRDWSSRLFISVVKFDGQDDVRLRWSSIPASVYEVEASATLAGASWRVLTSVSAEGDTAEVVVSRAAGPFYRVRRVTQ